MELTIDYLKENGYTTNHPEKTLAKYYKTNNSPEWRIVVEPKFNTNMGVVTYDIECSSYNGNGCLKKRTTVSTATTIEELVDCENLCGIS